MARDGERAGPANGNGPGEMTRTGDVAWTLSETAVLVMPKFGCWSTMTSSSPDSVRSIVTMPGEGRTCAAAGRPPRSDPLAEELEIKTTDGRCGMRRAVVLLAFALLARGGITVCLDGSAAGLPELRTEG